MTWQEKIKLILQKTPRIHPGRVNPEFYRQLEQDKDLQTRDFFHCSHSFVYFSTGHYKTRDEHAKEIRRFPVKKYLVFLALLLSAKDDKGNPLFPQILFIKSRQILMSLLTLGYLLWDCLFHDVRLNIIQAKRAEDADDLIKRVYNSDKRNSYRELPEFIRQEFDVNPSYPRSDTPGMGKPLQYQLEIYKKSGQPYSWIKGLPQGPEAIQQFTGSITYEDEFQKQDKCNNVLSSAMPAVTGGGQIILVGTVPDEPNEEWEKLARIPKEGYIEVMKGLRVWQNEAGFLCAQIHYSADPDKDPDTEKGRIWKELARKGFPDEASWRRQMEIDWTAKSEGAKFPEFDERKDLILKELDYDPKFPILRGWDFGYDPSFSVVVIMQFAMEQEDWTLRILRTIKHHRMEATEFIPRVIFLCDQHYPNAQFFDFPDIHEKKQTHLGNVFLLLTKFGIYPLCQHLTDETKAFWTHWILRLKPNNKLYLEIDHRYNQDLISGLGGALLCQGESKIKAKHPEIDAYDAFSYPLCQIFYDEKPYPSYLKCSNLTEEEDDEEEDEDWDEDYD